MPTNVKCVIGFNAAEGYGWSETHYWQSGGDTPDLSARLDNLVSVVCPARAQLLGAGCDIKFVRVSYKRNGAIASRSASVFIDGPDDQGSASQSASLAVSFIDSTSTRKKIVHLRGFWDAVESNQIYQPNNPLAAGWTDRFIQWKQTLIAGGYGWLSVQAALSPRGSVINFVEAADGIVTFTLFNVGAVLPAVGTIVTVKFARLNNSKSVLNRALKCEVTGANTVKTTAPIATGPFTGQGTFKVYVNDFTAYAETGTIKLGERRMGAPLDHYP